MENNNQPVTSSSQNQNQPTGKEKVLQPTAASIESINAALVEENQNTPAPNNQSPQITAPTLISQPQTPVSPASIYPEATKGVGIPAQNPVQEPTAPSTEQSPVETQIIGKIILVRIVAGLMILINALNVINWFLGHNYSAANLISIIEILIMLALAIYIFKLSEAARAAYVFIASILIVITLINLTLFEIHNHNNPVFKYSYSSLSKEQLQQGITATKNNPRLSSVQKQQITKTLQNQLNLDNESPLVVKFKQLLSYLLLLLVTVGPLILFTRPSIKTVFE